MSGQTVTFPLPTGMMVESTTSVYWHEPRATCVKIDQLSICQLRVPRLSELAERPAGPYFGGFLEQWLVFEPTKVGGADVSKTGRVSNPAREKAPPERARPLAGAETAQVRRGARAKPDAIALKTAELRTTSEVARGVAAAVKVLQIEPGIYALHIGRIDSKPCEVSGMTLPMTHVGSPGRTGAGAEIVASYPQRGSWFGPEGGTVVINSPTGGGSIIVTSYGDPQEAAVSPELDLRRLDRPDLSTAPAAARSTPAPALAGREIPTEILLHIERAGDRVFPGRGWVGALGRKLRIEGFTIRPLEGLLPGDVEFKGFEANGQETPWVSAGTLCGTRGRGLPLTGFAVRLAAHLRDRFEAVYEGSFFSAGIVGPNRDGEPCRSAIGNDPLEALNIRLIEKAPRPTTGPAEN